MGIFDRIKGWFMNLLPMKDEIFKKFGVVPTSNYQAELVDKWLAAYQNGGGLSFPSVVCWDLSKKALGELEIRAVTKTGNEDEFAQGVIDKLLEPHLRGQLEYALALGGVVARPWYNGQEIEIGWYPADMVIPTAWAGSRLTGVILVDRHRTKHNTYLKLESIQPITGGWNIKTKLFKGVGEGLGTEVPLTDIPMWATIDPEVEIYDSEVPPFVYMKTPWANNKVLNSPLGSSIYRDALTAIEGLEEAYSALCWEIEAGKAAVFLSDSMVPVDPKTMKDTTTKTEKRMYRKLVTESGKDLLEPYTPELRVEQLNAAIKTQLAIACMACHLDAGAYIYDQSMQAVTATEVRTRQQQTYGTLVDIQYKMVEPFIHDYLAAIRLIQQLYEIEALDEVELSIDFGDSVLVDEQADRTNAQSEVTAGLRSKLSYLMEYRGMSEEEALKELESIKADAPPVIDFFGGA